MRISSSRLESGRAPLSLARRRAPFGGRPRSPAPFAGWLAQHLSRAMIVAKTTRVRSHSRPRTAGRMPARRRPARRQRHRRGDRGRAGFQSPAGSRRSASTKATACSRRHAPRCWTEGAVRAPRAAAAQVAAGARPRWRVSSPLAPAKSASRRSSRSRRNRRLTDASATSTARGACWRPAPLQEAYDKARLQPTCCAPRRRRRAAAPTGPGGPAPERIDRQRAVSRRPRPRAQLDATLATRHQGAIRRRRHREGAAKWARRCRGARGRHIMTSPTGGPDLHPRGPGRRRPAGPGPRDHRRHLPGKRYAGQVSFVASKAEFTPRNVQTREEPR